MKEMRVRRRDIARGVEKGGEEAEARAAVVVAGSFVPSADWWTKLHLSDCVAGGAKPLGRSGGGQMNGRTNSLSGVSTLHFFCLPLFSSSPSFLIPHSFSSFLSARTVPVLVNSRFRADPFVPLELTRVELAKDFRNSRFFFLPIFFYFSVHFRPLCVLSNSLEWIFVLIFF